MNIRGAPDLGQPSDDLSSGGERERIRQRMKMVIGQLEGILRELKEVAKELREVVSQIDKLTSDFDFELEPDDWTTATLGVLLLPGRVHAVGLRGWPRVEPARAWP
ncbi:Inhibitory synaptic factor 1 [Manis javanica]|nr:Inhibitory synaptic factor 1 [Manis javanica]